MLKEQPSESALVVEGGALRGVFSTGLLDAFLEARFNPFDLFIGVSSGASNLAAYLAGMIGRNRNIYMDYSLRPDFISYPKFLRGGHLLDLDWLWDITIREVRLDLASDLFPGEALRRCPDGRANGRCALQAHRRPGSRACPQGLERHAASVPCLSGGRRPTDDGRRSGGLDPGRGGNPSRRPPHHGHSLTAPGLHETPWPVRTRHALACAALPILAAGHGEARRALQRSGSAHPQTARGRIDH